MLDFIKNIFSSNSIPTTSFLSLYQKIIKWRESNVYPYSFNLPEAISFPESFWKDIVKIYKMTNSDNKEKAISVWFADGDLIVTSVTKGNESSVTTKDSLSVKYIPHPTRKDYYRREIYVNNKLERRTDVYYKNVPKKVDIKYLFNMHTHPKDINADGSIHYSFFSAQDVRSLISSGAVMTGLVTDRLWLLIRTSDSPNSVSYDDSKALTIDDLKNDMKFCVYCAEFNRKAIKQ